MQRLIGRDIGVPASIGNVGPGFDTVGLAVSLFLRVRVRDVRRDGRGRLHCVFPGAQPVGPNRVARGYFARKDGKPDRPSLEIEVTSDIPQRAGLGSSAAATVAGLLLRDMVEGRRPAAVVLGDATRIEKHPDNAAAAWFGGLTTSAVLGNGQVYVNRWDWPQSWRLIVATPERGLSTDASRRALPRRIPLKSVVFNCQRVSALLAAVRDRDGGALRSALDDRVHQPYRVRLVPQLRELLELQHPDLLGVCLSGAGPSVVAIAARNLASVAEAVSRVYRRAGEPCTIRTLNAWQETLR